MMGRRQKLKNGDEWDMAQHAPLAVFDHAGVRKRIKRRLNRRWRKELKEEIRGIR
jgi:hypothetical protein